jgi:hypothetical protein
VQEGETLDYESPALTAELQARARGRTKLIARFFLAEFHTLCWQRSNDFSYPINEGEAVTHLAIGVFAID